MSEVWEEIKKKAIVSYASKKLPKQYFDRLKFEIKEIEKQGAEAYWTKLHLNNKQFSDNPNNLILPWLLGMIDNDPISSRRTPLICSSKYKDITAYKDQHGFLPHDINRDPDMPDIDIDCLPEARDRIKDYAISTYGVNTNDGYGSVCSVGTWQTYKFKSAIIDVAIALGLLNKYEAEKFTKDLPDDVDDLQEGGKSKCKAIVKKDNNEAECGFVHSSIVCPRCNQSDTEQPTIEQLLQEHDKLRQLNDTYPDIIAFAIRLIGKTRNMGMHSGALIITDRPLYGNIPLAKNGKRGFWISMWPEGRSSQLSKFGYIKWDFLGLKTLKYIYDCSNLIFENRGISFGDNLDGLDDSDIHDDRLGYVTDINGNKHKLSYNDKAAIKLANDLKVDGIFQFDTDTARSILANGVKSFNDLLLFNAMGHPGPMQAIPDVVANRDDTSASWKSKLHPMVLAILGDTYGHLVYQEQLTALWQSIAGLTATEAQEARKAVAKKNQSKLKAIKTKWIEGATPILGAQSAEAMWQRQETFGRYAFNKSHAVAYCTKAMITLILKAHFAPEFWASILSSCHPDKRSRFMGVARSEKWRPTELTNLGRKHSEGFSFGTININNLTINYTVTGNVVNQGLIGIKNIGKKMAPKLAGRSEKPYESIEEFIAAKSGSKVVLERFIKLGAFRNLPGHENSKALWTWFEYEYGNGKKITELRKEIRNRLLEQDGWNETTIKEEILRQIQTYKATYPKRNKIPDKILKWKPKPDDNRQRVMNLCHDDYTSSERLEFQKEYLGYYLESPMDVYSSEGGTNIGDSKAVASDGGMALLEAIVVKFDIAVSKTNRNYGRLVVEDGIQQALMFIWGPELALNEAEAEFLTAGTGITMVVQYDNTRNTFALQRGQKIKKLKQRH